MAANTLIKNTGEGVSEKDHKRDIHTWNGWWSSIQTYQDNLFSDSFVTQDKLLETCKYYHSLYPALCDKIGDFSDGNSVHDLFGLTSLSNHTASPSTEAGDMESRINNPDSLDALAEVDCWYREEEGNHEEEESGDGDREKSPILGEAGQGSATNAKKVLTKVKADDNSYSGRKKIADFWQNFMSRKLCCNWKLQYVRLSNANWRQTLRHEGSRLRGKRRYGRWRMPRESRTRKMLSRIPGPAKSSWSGKGWSSFWILGKGIMS